ncbi:cysteine hydrolase family protein [Micromonospora globbae]|uniref:Isochorismatase family protein n=1 Tax=Micromonospora globbae TaxID=1894969 RepID=A0A420F682_9ACTN|nr:cysteine hydrolase [Micromonospora globbae]RKF28425.1 isochorismatase family protein [Micromonospora globbae]WTF84727.1 cysteine hydrolase [Micromonospora globbae]
MRVVLETYGDTGDGGVRLGGGAARWHLYDDHVHLTPHHTGGRLARFEAELLPFVEDLDACALAVIDMQNDFCSPGGWTDRSGLDHTACRAAVPGAVRAVEAARRHGMRVIWIYWHNRPDLRNLGAPTLWSFKHRTDQAGIGEELDRGRVLTEGSWGASLVDELAELVDADDIRVPKFRMNGFHGTQLDQVLRTQGVRTLFLAGVNVDQCVSTTMEDAYFRDYGAVLLADATATSSPAYCKEAVIFNAKQCWGFVTTTERFAAPDPYPAGAG